MSNIHDVWRRRIAMAILQNGVDISSVQNRSRGAARVANALIGGMALRKQDQEQDSQDGVGLDAAGLDDVIKVQGGKNQGDAPFVTAQSAMPPLQAAPEAAMLAQKQEAFAPKQESLAPKAPISLNDKSIPASIRYNNPGAMWPGPSSKKFGSTEFGMIGGGNKIAAFDTPEAGVAAYFDLLNRRYAGKTMNAAIKEWSGNNFSDQYAANIAKATGIAPDTVITPELLRNPDIAIPLGKAQAHHEAGRPYPITDEQWRAGFDKANGGGKVISSDPAVGVDASQTQQAPQVQQTPQAPPQAPQVPQAVPGNSGFGFPNLGFPDAAISALRNDPSLADQFDAKYGPGSAAKIFGQDF